MTIAAYHLARALAHEGLRERADGSVITVGHEGIDRFDDDGPARHPQR